MGDGQSGRRPFCWDEDRRNGRMRDSMKRVCSRRCCCCSSAAAARRSSTKSSGSSCSSSSSASSAVSMGVLLGTFMGGMCLGSLLLPRVHAGRRASASSVRRARARHRRHRSAGAVRHAARRRRLHGLGRQRRGGHHLPRGRGSRLPAAADAADGRDASGDRPLGGDDAATACRGSGSSTAATSPAPSLGSLLAGFYLLRVFDISIATYVGGRAQS